MQVTIARQLGLDPSTVSNFFMNARRRSVDKWKDDRDLDMSDMGPFDDDDLDETDDSPLALTSTRSGGQGQGGQGVSVYQHSEQVLKSSSQNQAVLVTAANPAAVVQHLQPQDAMTPTAALDLWPPNDSALNKRGLSNQENQVDYNVTCKTP